MLKKISQSAYPWLWLSAFIVLLDQLSKWAIVSRFNYADSKTVLPFLNLTLRYNTGAAYSFLGSQDGWQIYLLIILPIIIVVLFTFWLFRTSRKDYLLALGLSLVIGGALGNMIDRIRLGYVVDFVDFHIHAWHFATFNVGDAAVSVGAFFLIVKLLLNNGKG